MAAVCCSLLQRRRTSTAFFAGLYTSSLLFFLAFKQKTAYELRISDWSSDVCSSDLSWPDPAALREAGDRRSHDLLVSVLSAARPDDAVRSEERRVGKECVSTC